MTMFDFYVENHLMDRTRLLGLGLPGWKTTVCAFEQKIKDSTSPGHDRTANNTALNH
jgi:hypothetical protein